MVYREKLVACIKCNGKILRDYHEGVYLPFGSEYSILLKNLHSRKALVDVFVDGRTVITGLILHPSKYQDNSVELERFFEEDLNKGHKLKFIEKTDDIREYRGEGPEDGMVRIHYRFEKEPPKFDFPPIYRRWDWTIGGGNKFIGDNDPHDFYQSKNGTGTAPDKSPFRNISSGGDNGPAFTASNNLNSAVNHVMDSAESMSVSANSNQQIPQSNEGITVEGEYSSQQFTYGHIGPTESEEHVIAIPLRGSYYNKEDAKVKEPIGSRDKIQCKTCGVKHKSGNRFCSKCGTSLI